MASAPDDVYVFIPAPFSAWRHRDWEGGGAVFAPAAISSQHIWKIPKVRNSGRQHCRQEGQMAFSPVLLSTATISPASSSRPLCIFSHVWEVWAEAVEMWAGG